MYRITRDLRQMGSQISILLSSFLSDWEDILCGPRAPAGTCFWINVNDLTPWTRVIPSYEYFIFFLDKIDIITAWISLTIGNIIDAVQKDTLYRI